MTTSVQPTRRTVLAATAGAAVTAAVAACGGSKTGTARAAAPAAGSTAASAPPPASAASSPAGGKPLAAVADIPVGSAVSAKGPDGAPVIVSRPSSGQVVAFSAVCTHMGCTVAPAGKQLHCPCHGSVYDAATGAVVHGPAPRALSEVAVHVANGEVLPGTA